MVESCESEVFQAKYGDDRCKMVVLRSMAEIKSRDVSQKSERTERTATSQTLEDPQYLDSCYRASSSGLMLTELRSFLYLLDYMSERQLLTCLCLCVCVIVFLCCVLCLCVCLCFFRDSFGSRHIGSSSHSEILCRLTEDSFSYHSIEQPAGRLDRAVSLIKLGELR